MEDDGDRPGWSRLVLGTGEVPVEDPADRVAGQVLQDGIDDELVRTGCPGPAGRQLPRLLPAADLGRAVDELAAWSAHLQAPGEQAVIQRAVEGDPQRFANVPAGGAVSSQLAGSTWRRSSPPTWYRCSAGCPQRESLARHGIRCRRPAGMARPGAAGNRPSWWPVRPRLIRAGSSRTVSRRREASHSSCSVGSKAPAMMLPSSRASRTCSGGAALAHRRGEPDVEPEQVDRHLGLPSGGCRSPRSPAGRSGRARTRTAAIVPSTVTV